MYIEEYNLVFSFITASTSGHILQQPTVIVPKRQKSKRANKNISPTSPEAESLTTSGSIRRKPSIKKNNSNKKVPLHTEVTQNIDSVTPTLSPVESPIANLPSPYDSTSLYSNVNLTQAGLENLMASKQPPSYEDVVKNNLGFSLDSNYGPFTMFPDAIIMQQRQMQANTLSPPYSNQSPPHSIQSNLSLSPQGYNGSPSPAKNRPSLPTSPTHIAAMRAATQQKHGGVPQTHNLQMGFDFSQIDLPLAMSSLTSTSGGSLHPQQFHQQKFYLSPPSQHSDHLMPENYPTPSPESAGHWSSSSPRSCTSDWSENISSSPTYVSTGQTNKGSDAIYI